MPARGMRDFPASALIAIARDPDAYERQLADIALRAEAADEAERKAREAQKHLDDTRAAFERTVKAENAKLDERRNMIANREAEIVRIEEAQQMLRVRLDKRDADQVGTAQRLDERERNMTAARDRLTAQAEAIEGREKSLDEREAAVARQEKAHADRVRAFEDKIAAFRNA